MKETLFGEKILLLFCAILICLACVACGENNEEANEDEDGYNTKTTADIRIATKNTPDQNILANLAKILIKEKMGIDATVVYYDDSTSPALLEKLRDNSIQIFFDYAGSLAVNALEYDPETINSVTILQDVQNDLKKDGGILVSEEIGYNATSTIYMMASRREELGIATLTNLSQYADKLKIGMNEAFFKREDCFEALCAFYNEMEFKSAEIYTEEEGYSALSAGKIDVFIGAAASPYRSLFDVRALVDDKHFFLPQNTCYLLSGKVQKSVPQLEIVLSNMEGLISASRMSLMIRRIYWEGNDIDEYLHTYLRANNII